MITKVIAYRKEEFINLVSDTIPDRLIQVITVNLYQVEPLISALREAHNFISGGDNRKEWGIPTREQLLSSP